MEQAPDRHTPARVVSRRRASFSLISFTIVVLLASALAGCASTGARADEARRREQAVYDALTRMGLVRTESVRNIPALRMQRWSDLDDYNILITARGRERYLVTFPIRCVDLAFATGISTGPQTRSLAVNDSLIVQMMNGSQQRCRVSAITRLEDIPGYVEDDTAPPEG